VVSPGRDFGETGSGFARCLPEWSGSDCGSVAVFYELTNVLRYKSDLSVYQVQQAAESLFEMDLLIVPPTASVMQLAVDIARTYDITIYDAAFVALAQTLPAAFVTADERLSKRLVAFSFVYFLGEVPV
jgi:predicted nucleic acid-binding protein